MSGCEEFQCIALYHFLTQDQNGRGQTISMAMQNPLISNNQSNTQGQNWPKLVWEINQNNWLTYFNYLNSVSFQNKKDPTEYNPSVEMTVAFQEVSV